MRKLLPLTLALGLLSGCGSESDTKANNAYVSKLNAAQRSFDTALQRAATGITEASPTSTDRRSLRGFASAASAYAAQLKAIDVPGPARDAHGQLIDAVDDYSKVISDTEVTLRDSTPSRLARVPGDLRRAVSDLDRRLRAATQVINEKLGAA